ncbi:uncharacterized protein isoform X2 [Leptinotarsa decemlineata]|uniref:uncharacterized protein isoform X2 n=1 Tax=Leptinotarsa decemlineata TaxID=7539 RepID=UPI003D306FF4
MRLRINTIRVLTSYIVPLIGYLLLARYEELYNRIPESSSVLQTIIIRLLHEIHKHIFRYYFQRYCIQEIPR